MSSSKQCTQYFTCGTLTAPACTQETAFPNNTVLYTMQTCTAANNVCNWLTADPVKNPTVSCTTAPSNTTPSYPGGSCNSNTTTTPCYGSSVCTNNTCTGVAVGGVCTTHSDCLIGNSCYKGVCRAQAPQGGECASDYDCVNNFGCNGANGCQQYFSQANGAQVAVISLGDLSLCQSGEEDSNGKCISQTNVGTAPYDCTDLKQCQYTNSDNSTTTDPNACTCAKSFSGKSYCPIGSGMPTYQSYVSALNAYVTSTVGKCHTLERLNCPSVNTADKSAGFTKQYTASVNAKFGHELTDAPSCVYSTLFPNAVAPPVVNNGCAKVSCGKLTNSGCAQFTVDPASGNKTFTGQLCGTGQNCPGVKEIFAETASKNITCITPTVVPQTNRYPGEKCDANNQCYNNQTCNNVCAGVAAGGNCTDDANCTVGYYCNSTVPTINGTCNKQLGPGSNCTKDYMCPQTQGCLNGICTDYYSKLLSTDVSATVGTASSTFCQSKAVDTNNKCYGKTYNNMTIWKDGLVQCKPAQICNFTDSNNASVTESCQCSYDKDGNSYCRKAYSDNDKNWQSLASNARSQMSSTSCHTKSRFACWDVAKTTLTSTYNAQISTVYAPHLFYAEECIQKLFNSGEFLKLSFFVLAAFLINLF